MSNSNLLNAERSLVDEAAQSVNHAIESTQRQAASWAHEGAESVRNAGQQLQNKTRHVSDSTVHYIQHDPVKAMLIAAATGAALMALIGLMTRSAQPRQ